MRYCRFVIFLLLAVGLHAFTPLDVERKIHKPIDIMAAGGAGVTAYDKFGMFYMNPATFAVREKGTLSVLKLGASANYDLINYYTLYQAIEAAGGDITKLPADQVRQVLRMSANVGVTGPLGFGYIADGMGLLLYDEIMTTATVKQSAGLPFVDFGTYLETGLIVGYGFKIPVPAFLGRFTRAYGGVIVKYLHRFKYENKRMSFLELVDFGMSVMNFNKGFLWGQAIGSDLGLLVKDEQWAFGLVFRDWFNTAFSWTEYTVQFEPVGSTNPITYFPASCDIGASYRIPSVLPRYLISDLTFSLDLVNIFDFTENFFLKTRIGMEFSAFGFLRLRTGVYKGYPTAGIGFMLPLLTINATYYTEELGSLPGSVPQSILIAEVQLQF